MFDFFIIFMIIIITNMLIGSILRKSMEETIEFLQIELEKDFGYHDDSAIQALQQSIQELK